MIEQLEQQLTATIMNQLYESIFLIVLDRCELFLVLVSAVIGLYMSNIFY